MQQPQSSSTLHNYISSGQNNQDSSHHHHQQSSSCVQCQHINKLEKHSGSDSDSGSSSGDDGELVQPLHRHIIEHSRQIQATITNLQQQIQKLKNANSSKDTLIEQLRRQLKQLQVSKIGHSVQQDAQEAQFLRRQIQIQKIRKQLYHNSQNIMHPNKMSTNSPLIVVNEQFEENSINQDLKQRLKKVEVMFQDKSRGLNRNQKGNQNQKNNYSKKIQFNHANNSSSQSSDDEKIHNQQNQKKPNKTINRQSSQNQRFPTSNNNRRPSKQQFQSQQFQNDNNSIDSSLEYELNQHSQKITRLEKHIQFCEDQMLWMTNFIIAFLRMGEKLMSTFKQPLLKQHWTMRKKTKIAWRYAKHVLAYLIS